MKASEFRKLIREEVRKALNEDPRFDAPPLKNLAKRSADMAARAKANAMRGIGNVGQTVTTSKLDPNATYKINVGTSRGEFDPSDIKKVSGQPSMVAKAVMKMAYDDLIDADYEEDEILSEYVRMFKLDEYTYYIMTGEEDVVVVGSPKSKKYGKFWSLIETDPEAAESMFEDIEEDSTNADEIELK